MNRSVVSLAGVAIVWTTFASIGDPALRHDWLPVVPGVRAALDSVTGWNPLGLGSPVGYPASFLYVIALGAVAAAAGPYAAHVLFMAAIAGTIVWGASRLAESFAAGPFARVAAALFMLFNPWVYAKLVAGHTFMLLAYGATAWIVGECLAPRHSARALVPAALLVAPQIQFLLVASPAIAYLSYRTRDIRPIASVAFAALPVAVGIALTRSSLLGIPLTQAWELNQSVDPLHGILLRGYFTGYDAPLDPLLTIVMCAVLALSLAGAVTGVVRDVPVRWILAATAAALLVAFGLRGPLAPALSYAVPNVPELGLFRELYDLIGFAAMGYCALCLRAARSYTPLGAAFLVASAALAGSWLLWPPSRYWVDAHSLPATIISAPAHTRVALIPAIGPLGFGGRGSGLDPGVRAYPNDVVTLDEPGAQFPINSAFGTYLATGAVDPLRSLGVSEIVVRPWLATDVGSIGGVLAFPPSEALFGRLGSSQMLANALPELTLSQMPQIGGLDAAQGAGNVFFGDAAEASLSDESTLVPKAWSGYDRVIPVRAPNRFVRAANGWVDARLGFLERPEFGQAFGGALTADSRAVLEIAGGRDALVWVSGRLIAQDGTTLSRTTGGYRWVRVPIGVRSLTCDGTCAVAAETLAAPRDLPLEPPRRPYRPIAFERRAPWLVVADVDTAGAGEQLLRYDVRYDAHWWAFAGTQRLPHVRVDTVVNGWLLPPLPAHTRVVIVELAAAVTAFAELVSALGISIMIATIAVPLIRAARTRARVVVPR